MSGISIYSALSAFFCFQVMIFIVAVLRRNTNFLVKNSTSVLLMLISLSFIRFFLPLDLKYSFIIRSWNLFPSILQALRTPIFGVQTIGDFLIVLWILGSAIAFLAYTISFLSEIRDIKSYLYIENEQADRVLCSLKYNKTRAVIQVSPNVDVPKVTGFRKAHIYLPELNLSDDELALVIQHELQHFRNKDIYIKVFYLTLAAAFWWNPLVVTFYREVDRLLEFRCDSAVASKMNSEERILYLDVFLKVLQQTIFVKKLYPSVSSALVTADTNKFVTQRFAVILDQPKTQAKRKWFAIIISVLCIVLSYFVIIQPAGFPASSEFSGYEVELNNENGYILKTNEGQFFLYINGEFWDEISEDSLYESTYINIPIQNEE